MKSKKAIRQLEAEEKDKAARTRESRKAKAREAERQAKAAERLKVKPSAPGKPLEGAKRRESIYNIEKKYQFYANKSHVKYIEFKANQGMSASHLIRTLIDFAIAAEAQGTRAQEIKSLLSNDTNVLLQRIYKRIRRLERKVTGESEG